MIQLWKLYENGKWVEPFLIVSICLFVGVSVVLYLLIIESRNRKIKREKLRAEYRTKIEKLMFSVVFQNVSFLEVKENREYMALWDVYLFRKVMTESILDLHKNYEGIYAQKLEQFYKESGLINTSFKKLKSLKWEVKCKGITELAEMNVVEAFDKMVALSKARNKALKIIAINACIKLAGTKGIVHLTTHPHPIDDWTQLNIIAAFKKHDIGDTKGVELLLESQNTTVVTLGLKLIKELRLTQKLKYVEQLINRAPNASLKYEAQSVLQMLSVITI